jgi:hypothetical protein
VSGFLNFDEKIIATTIKLAHAKVSRKIRGRSHDKKYSG